MKLIMAVWERNAANKLDERIVTDDEEITETLKEVMAEKERYEVLGLPDGTTVMTDRSGTAYAFRQDGDVETLKGSRQRVESAWAH